MNKINTTEIYFILFISIGLHFFSCATNPKDIVLIDGFPEKLKIETHQLDSFLPLCPGRINFSEGYLLTTTNCSNKLISSFHIKTNRTENFILKGNGPGEFTQLYFSGHHAGDSILLRSLSGMAAWVSPSKLFNDSTYLITKISEPNEINNAENVFNFGNEWAYTDLSGEAFMIFLNNDGTIKQKVDHYPKLDVYYEDETKGYLYYSNTTWNSKKEMFVSAMRYFPHLLILDKKGNLKKIIQTRMDFISPQFTQGDLLPQKDAEYFYDQVVTSDDYIFALRMNATLNDLATLQNQPILEVFDWDGNGICEVEFDRFLGGFSLDQATGKLYAGSICFDTYKQILLMGESNHPIWENLFVRSIGQ